MRSHMDRSKSARYDTSMTWSEIPQPPRKIERQPDPALRISSKLIGYLNAEAREYLFGREKRGLVAYEIDEHNTMSIVPTSKGVVVGKTGTLSVSAVTSRTQVKPPFSISLTRSKTEKRLVFTGVNP